VKRFLDIFISTIGIIFLLPIFITIGILIKLDSKGPIFFKQIRIGKDEKPFFIYKFRTMKMDATQQGPSITKRDDPRITKIGKILRRYKIDELPQLFNVLFGSMSFVGPRPDVPGFADKLEGEDRHILSLRPGITGPASLKYKEEEQLLAEQKDPERYNREVIWPDKVKINLDYLKSWSLKKDIIYIIRTVTG